MPKPIIFLDVDGVLNEHGDWNNYPSQNEDYRLVLSPHKVKRLLKFQKEIDADIVLSSTWRRYPHACEQLNKVGIFWIDMTPIKGPFDGVRGHEIALWLSMSDHNNRPFIILDDDPSPHEFKMLKDKLVLTDFMKGGLTNKHIIEARKILTKQIKTRIEY